MKISAYSMSVETFAPMLTNLSAVLDKAAQFAEAKKIDPTILVNARLAPDMFALSLQVFIACRHANEAMVVLAGKNMPDMGKPPATLVECKALVEKTIAFVKSVPASDFEGADERQVVLPLFANSLELVATGSQYLKDWAISHFYFHVVTAYDILRHNGVELGKRDYLGHAGSLVRPRKP